MVLILMTLKVSLTLREYKSSYRFLPNDKIGLNIDKWIRDFTLVLFLFRKQFSFDIIVYRKKFWFFLFRQNGEQRINVVRSSVLKV